MRRALVPSGVCAAASPPTRFPVQYSPALPWGTTRFGMGLGGAMALSATHTPQVRCLWFLLVMNNTFFVRSSPAWRLACREVRRREYMSKLSECVENRPRPLVRLGSSWLPTVHRPPIDPVVFRGSYLVKASEKAHLEAGFPLRCCQRLSLPNVATQRCTLPYNWHTSGSSSPVLSY